MEDTTPDAKSVTEKRAQYERMAFTVCKNGYVNVCNQSHNDDSAHTYSVETRHGSAVGCSCPHYQHRSPAEGCKHMLAVESNPLVLSSATAAGTAPVARADGGHVETDEHTYDSPKVTIHREPEQFGGALYGRCETCGVECVADTDGCISVMHEESCPGDSNPNDVNETPL